MANKYTRKFSVFKDTPQNKFLSLGKQIRLEKYRLDLHVVSDKLRQNKLHRLTLMHE